MKFGKGYIYIGVSERSGGWSVHGLLQNLVGGSSSVAAEPCGPCGPIAHPLFAL